MAISKHHAVRARASDAALHRDMAAWLEVPRCRIPEAVSPKPAIDLNQTRDSLILAGVDRFNQDPTGQPTTAASEYSRCSDDAEPVLQGYPEGRTRSEVETRSLTRTATFFPQRPRQIEPAALMPAVVCIRLSRASVGPAAKSPLDRKGESVCLLCTATRKRQSRFLSRLWVTNKNISAPSSKSQPSA